MPFRRSYWGVLGVVALCGLAGTAAPARASFVVLNNPNEFAAGSTLITFDEENLQPFQVVTSYRGVQFRALGAPPNTQPTAAFDPTPPREFGPGGTAGRTIIQVQFPPVPAQGMEVTLPGLVRQFGGEFSSVSPGDFTFTLFNGAQQVDVVTIPRDAEPGYRFYAFEDSSAFDRVVIRGPGVNDGRVILDNLRFGPVGATAVPEPATLTLAGLGIAGLAWAARRRARAAR